MPDAIANVPRRDHVSAMIQIKWAEARCTLNQLLVSAHQQRKNNVPLEPMIEMSSTSQLTQSMVKTLASRHASVHVRVGRAHLDAA